MKKIGKPGPQTTSTTSGIAKPVKKPRAASTKDAQKAQKAGGRSILILDGVDLDRLEVRPRESGDPLTVQAGLHQIASRVYGYGGKEEGQDQLVGQLAQVVLRAADRAQLDPDLAQMTKRGLKQSLNPTGQTQLTEKQLDDLAKRLVSALSEVISSS